MGEKFRFSFGGYMTISEMLSQSGLLTLLGMGVVFAFIIVLIGGELSTFCWDIASKCTTSFDFIHPIYLI